MKERIREKELKKLKGKGAEKVEEKTIRCKNNPPKKCEKLNHWKTMQ